MLILMKTKSFIKSLLTGLFLLSALSMTAQQHTVTGTVVDADNGEPLIGVGVIVSTGGGTTTDANGSYSVTVDEGATLTFSYMGYLDVVETVDGRSQIDARMTLDTELLEEVVVLGYTSQKKNELSSSIVSVDSEALKDVTTTDLGNMLQGKAAGVLVMNSTGQPGSSAQIRIRGTGSISAGASPLYVVDGVAGGSFNPNDVETLTVLKDASASALYGAAASGGVIVVTTKSAKSDQATVTFKAQAGVKQALFGRFSPMDSEELYYTHKDVMDPILFSSQRPKSLLDQDFNWMDAMFNTGVVQDYYASAAGKIGKLSYFTSISHYDEEGTLINTGYDRSSARLNLSAPLGQKVTLDVRLNYNRSNDQQASSYVTLEAAYRALPWDNPYDENTGEPIKIDGPNRSDNGDPWYSHDKYNVMHNEQYNYAKNNNEDIMADFQLTWNITDWLMFTSTNRFSSSNWFSETYIDPRTVSPSYSDGYISNSSGSSWGFGTTNLFKAAKDFKGGHSVNGVLGIEYGEGFSRQMSADGDKMPNGQASLSNSVMRSVGGYNYRTRSWAWLAQAQYSYKGRYVVTGSIRYDETSRFAPNARGGYFPGVSAAWVINEEPFMQNQNVVSLLKLRGGYGKTGNDSIEDFLWQDIYDLSAQYQGVVAAVLERQQNPNLGWEEAYMASLGLDITFTPGIDVTIDLYDTRNTNLLLAVPRASSTGFFEFMDNVGTVRNRGIEVAFNAAIFNRKNFSWNAGFNIGLNRNNVEYLPNGEFLQTVNNVSQQVKVGQDINSWYMPKWLGVDPDNGDPLWEVIEEDGTKRSTNNYSEATYQVVGKATPLFSGGINTDLRYKGWTLSIVGNFVYGNKIFNYTRISMDSDGASTNYNMVSLDNGLGWSRWEEPGDVATHPKLTLNGNKAAQSVSSRYLEDGSFFRLRNVTLSYNIPESFAKKLRMKGARVYVSADNLFTLTRFSGADPEVSLESSSWELAGMYSMNYPVPRTFVGGIEITF